MLFVNTDNALGTSTVTIASGGELEISGSVTIANGLATSGTIENLSAGNSLSGPMDLTGTTTFAGANDLTLSGQISGIGNLVAAGSGTLYLTSTNSYTGTTLVSGGVLSVDINGALSTGSVTINSGSELDLSGTLTVTNALTISGTGVTGTGVVQSLSGSSTLSGPVSLGANAAIGGTNDLVISGVISGSFDLTKLGGGTATLTAANTFSGTTYVQDGALYVNGSGVVGNVQVTGATLGGTGTVGDVTVTGGTLSPGTATGATGILTTGNLSLDSSSNVNMAINGTTAGTITIELDVEGTTISLGNAHLNLSLGYPPSPSDSIILIDNEGGNSIGTKFNALPEGTYLTTFGAGKTFLVTYLGGSGNDSFVLTCVQDSTCIGIILR